MSEHSHPGSGAHEHDFDEVNPLAERRTRWVVILTAVTMVVELLAGWWYGSMALLADGWHMSSHVIALGLSVAAYALARRLRRDDRFAFGTWKIEVDKKELRVISVSRRVAQVFAPTQLSVGEPGTEPARNRLYINLVMVKKPEGWQIVSILPILVPPQ